MKSKILNLGLILTSLFGYLEWGENNSMFLFQGEWEVLSTLFSDPLSIIHPFTMLPLLGQILLISTLFQKQPGRIRTFLGLGGIGVLLLLIFIAGIMGSNFKIVLSTLPFFVCAFLVVRHYVRHKN